MNTHFVWISNFFVWTFCLIFLHNQRWSRVLFLILIFWRVCKMTNILCQKFLAISSMNKLENTLGSSFVFSPKRLENAKFKSGVYESFLCHFRSVILWTGYNWIWTLTHSAINKRKLYSICKSPNCVFTHRQSWLK